MRKHYEQILVWAKDESSVVWAFSDRWQSVDMPSWNTNLRYVTVPPWAIEYFEAYKKGKLRRHGEAVTEDPVFDEDTGWSVSWCPFVQALCEGDDLTHKRADFIVRETLGCADISLDELRAWRERADESSVSRLVDLFLEGSDA